MKVLFFWTFNQNQIKEDGTILLDQASTFCELLASAGITSLFNTRLQEIAIFMFKIKNKWLPTNRLELFPRSQAEYHIHQEKELLRTENTDLGLMVEVKYER